MPDPTFPPPSDRSTVHRPSRRTVLAAAGGIGVSGALAAAFGSLGGSAEAATSSTCASVSPTVTEGPYWVDTQLLRSDIRANSDGTSTQAGVPLTLTISLFGNSSCSAPLSGAHVDIWHANAKGVYSDFSQEGTAGQTWLRGYQVSDANGKVTFTTIHPGWYTGRAIHIHVRVRTYSGSTTVTDFVSQFFFDESVNSAVLADTDYKADSSQRTVNTKDDIYEQEVSGGGALIVASSGSVSAGYTGAATLILAAAATSTTSATPTSSTPTTGTSSTSTATVTPTATTTTSPTNTVRAWLTSIAAKKRGSTRTLTVGVKADERVLMRVYAWNSTSRSWQWLGAEWLPGDATYSQAFTVPSWVRAGVVGTIVKLTDTSGTSRWYRSNVRYY